jgi:hypothetical protein
MGLSAVPVHPNPIIIWKKEYNYRKMAKTIQRNKTTVNGATNWTIHESRNVHPCGSHPMRRAPRAMGKLRACDELPVNVTRDQIVLATAMGGFIFGDHLRIALGACYNKI